MVATSGAPPDPSICRGRTTSLIFLDPSAADPSQVIHRFIHRCSVLESALRGSNRSCNTWRSTWRGSMTRSRRP